MAAILSDGKTKVTFPLVPETITTSINGEFTSNLVLDTKNPQIRPKGSATTYKLGRCLLLSPAGNVNQQQFIDRLTKWAQDQTKLSFSSNSLIVKTCYIKSLDLEVKIWKNGKPVIAEMEISLIEGLAESSSGKQTKAPKVTNKKATPRMQQDLKQKVQKKLRSPLNQKKISLADDNYNVEVDDQKKVIITYGSKEIAFEYDELMEKLG